MGLFKQMKDMKTMVSAAPGMIQQAQGLQAQAQHAAAAHNAAQVQAMMSGATIPAGDPRLEPIAGVTLDAYAAVCKRIQNQGGGADQAGIEAIAAQFGIDAASWQAAYDGWNARMKGDMQLATQFGHVFTASAG